MQSGIKWLSLILLLINALGAIPAGILFIIDPTGNMMGTSTELLRYSPFQNFLIPGIVLLIVNGVCSIVTFVLVVLKHKLAPWAVILQGVILTGWILIQVYMLQEVNPLHLFMGSIGIALMLLGYLMKKITPQTQQ